LSPPNAPAASPWQYSGTAGVDHNGASLTFNNPSAPDGTQVAYLQANGGISQSVNLIAGTYNILVQSRATCPGAGQGQQVQVLVDGSSVGTITPTAPFTIFTRRRISRLRPESTRSNSWAWLSRAAAAPP